MTLLARIRTKAAWYRAKARLDRLKRAWRYATGTLSQDDALHMLCEAEIVCGHWPLESISADSVHEDARRLYAKSPALKEYAYEAAWEISQCWDSCCGVAHQMAVEKIAEYATRDGVTLVRQPEDETEAA